MRRTERNFQQMIGWLAIMCIVALVSSCSSKPEDAIVGKWKEIGGTETMEFFKDGTVNVVDKGMIMGGSYKFIDKDRIRLEMRGLGALMGPIVAKVSILGGELIFTMPDRKVSKYSKLE